MTAGYARDARRIGESGGWASLRAANSRASFAAWNRPSAVRVAELFYLSFGEKLAGLVLPRDREAGYRLLGGVVLPR